ncbi:MAG: hypothetical protein LBD36_03195 [Holosporales bacterium]|nr:hypothetical protein [Holosporales bacterium]
MCVVEDVYQLLAARFCHDLASPINTIGLLLETSCDDTVLAKQNYALLVDLLNLYRIFFSYDQQEKFLEKTCTVIQSICSRKKVQFKLNINKNTNNKNTHDTGLSKIIACIFYIFIQTAVANDIFFIEETTDFNYELIFLNSRDFFYKELLDITNGSIERHKLHESKYAIHYLLQLLLKNCGKKLVSNIDNQQAGMTSLLILTHVA